MTKFMVAAVAAMTVAFAGGDIAPIETPVEISAPAKNFYVGGGLTAVQTYVNGQADWFNDTITSETGYGAQAQVGYVFYRTGAFSSAIEGRVAKTFYGYGIDEFELDGDTALLTYSALIKPQYNFGDFGVYGLVGYGTSKVTDSGFSVRENDVVYGGGVNYLVTDSFEVFADYTVNPAFEDVVNVENDVMVVGVNYKF